MDRIYFLATRKVLDSPIGSYKTFMVVKVADGKGALVAGVSEDICQLILDSHQSGWFYEVLPSSSITGDYYLKDLPIDVLLIPDVKVAQEFMRNRANFDYEAYAAKLTRLEPLAFG